MTRHPGTSPGIHAPLPQPGLYQPSAVPARASSLVVDFHGDDGRSASFDVGSLPLPGWHAAVAAALALRVGPAGGRRTHSSAMTVWAFVTRLLRFLDGVDDRPLHPAGLAVSHLERYLDRSTRPRAESTRTTDFNELRLLLRMPPMAAHLASDVLDHLGARAGKGTVSSIVGYSDGEFTRIVDAARRDVAALRSRITTGEGLLDHMPDVLTEPNQLVGPPLSAMADTGVVPLVGGSIVRHRQQRTAWAGQLFVTRADLAPLLTLLVAVTGRNVETLKELPAEHRIVGDRAVEVQLIKRRSGPNRWHDTVTWEIGPPHRDLHTPGGLYLLLHRLMARGRSLSNSSTIWSSWRNTNEQRGTVREHHDPFALTLTGAVDVGGWSRSQAIRTDTDAAGQDGGLHRRSSDARPTSASVGSARHVG